MKRPATREERLARSSMNPTAGGGRTSLVAPTPPELAKVQTVEGKGRASALVIAHEFSHPRSVADADLVVSDGDAAARINAAMKSTWDGSGGYPVARFLDGFYALEESLVPPYGMDLVGPNAGLYALDPATFTGDALIVLDADAPDYSAGQQHISGFTLGDFGSVDAGGEFDLIRILGAQQVWIDDLYVSGCDRRFLYATEVLGLWVRGVYGERALRAGEAGDWMVEFSDCNRVTVEGADWSDNGPGRTCRVVNPGGFAARNVFMHHNTFWSEVDIRDVFQTSFAHNHVNETLTVGGWQGCICVMNILQGNPTPIDRVASTYGTGFDSDCTVFGNQSTGTLTDPDAAPMEQVANAVGPVGALAHKIEVFDENGTSLGFVPVYAAIP